MWLDSLDFLTRLCLSLDINWRVGVLRSCMQSGSGLPQHGFERRNLLRREARQDLRLDARLLRRREFGALGIQPSVLQDFRPRESAQDEINRLLLGMKDDGLALRRCRRRSNGRQGRRRRRPAPACSARTARTPSRGANALAWRGPLAWRRRARGPRRRPERSLGSKGRVRLCGQRMFQLSGGASIRLPHHGSHFPLHGRIAQYGHRHVLGGCLFEPMIRIPSTRTQGDDGACRHRPPATLHLPIHHLS